MTLQTWLGFLIGRADCIELAAKSRGILALGLLFVLSAGLAREYDQEDLLHEPWHALLPLAVSLVTSFLLYALIQLFTAPPRGETRQFWVGYRSFLGLYWLMAPMAWLYAFPAERVFTDFGTVRMNLWLLFLVSVWRVALMTRIVQVLWKAPAWSAFIVVGWYSLTLAHLALSLSPAPILSIMGGVRLSAAEHLIAETTFVLRALTMLAWLPALLIMVFTWSIAERWMRPKWLPHEAPPNRSLWSVGFVLLVGLLALLPLTQPEQLRRTRAETLLRNGQIEEGLDYIAQLGLERFPPYWDPPPRVTYYGRQLPDIGAVIELHAAKPLPPTLEKIYLKKLVNAIANDKQSIDDRLRYIRVLLRMPNAAELLSGGYRHTLRFPLMSLPKDSPERLQLERLLEEQRE